MILFLENLTKFPESFTKNVKNLENTKRYYELQKNVNISNNIVFEHSK